MQLKTHCQHKKGGVQMLESSQFLRWRESSFLENARTPRTLAWSTTSAWYHFPDALLPQSFATGPHFHQVDAHALRAATADMDARVLRIQNLQPGMFFGFASAEEDTRFDAWFRGMMYDMKWCCTTQLVAFKEKRYDSLDFALPAPLRELTATSPGFTVRSARSALPGVAAVQPSNHVFLGTGV